MDYVALSCSGCLSGSIAIASALAAIAAATAVATASTAAAAAVAASATAEATTTAASTAASIFARTGFIDGQRPSTVLLPVQGGNSGLRLFVASHLNESKTFGPSGIPVVDDLG